MKQRHSWAAVALVLAMTAPSWSATYDDTQVVMPAGTVLKVRMDDTIGSNRSTSGDRFSATVDDSTLPSGTRVEGVVTEVTRAREDRPGMLDVEFRTLRLPDGQQYRINGSATSLDSKSVQRTSDGRLVAKSSKKNPSRFIAYGAGAGLIIGSLLGKNVVGAVLGAAAGYLYGQQSRTKANGREVVVASGTEFGVRLDQRLALAPAADNRYRRERISGYRATYDDRVNNRYRSDRTYDDRVDNRYRSNRENTRDDQLAVLVNDRPVSWGSARPFRSGSQMMVPLAPVLEATGMDYQYDRSNREIMMDRPRDVRLIVGSDVIQVDGRRARMSAPARVVGGSLYVPSDFFRHATDMQVRWNETGGTLTLRNHRYAP